MKAILNPVCGLILLSLLLLLTACGATPEPRVITQIETIEVPVEVYRELNPALVAACNVVALPQGTLRNRDLAEHIQRQQAALAECNDRMARIRSLQK